MFAKSSIFRTLSLLLVSLLATSCLSSFFNGKTKRRARHGYSKGSRKKTSAFYPIRKKIALLKFYNESPFGGEDLAFQATEELRRELRKSPEFNIDPQASAMFGTSKEVYAGGGAKLSQLSRKAKLSGINLVVYGRITHARVRQKTDEIGFVRKTKSYAESVLELRIFDVHSSKEIFFEKHNGNIDDNSFRFYMDNKESNLSYRQELLRYSIRVAIRRFVKPLMNLGSKLEWTGRVARIIGSKIYINAGRQSGINIGDILNVMTEGLEIYDPETGALIGVSKGELKGTLEIIDFFGPDGAVSILHSGGSVTEGDFVQLY
jgi:hypothetical protein